MSEYGTIQSHKQKLYLNGRWVSGVNSVDGQFSIPNETVSSIGSGFINSFRVGEFEGSFNFTKYIFGQDFFYKLLQSNDISGLLSYEGQNIGISQGIITSYSCSGSVGSLVESSISGVVFGKIGGSDFGLSTSDDDDPFIGVLASPGVKITSQDNIEVSNRLLSFDISIELPRIYKRIIGSAKPVKNAINYPIVCKISLNAAVHDYQIPILESFECNNEGVNLEIELNDCNGNTLQPFDFSGCKLISASFQSSLDDELTVDLEYEMLLNDEKFLRYDINTISVLNSIVSSGGTVYDSDYVDHYIKRANKNEYYENILSMVDVNAGVNQDTVDGNVIIKKLYDLGPLDNNFIQENGGSPPSRKKDGLGFTMSFNGEDNFLEIPFYEEISEFSDVTFFVVTDALNTGEIPDGNRLLLVQSEDGENVFYAESNKETFNNQLILVSVHFDGANEVTSFFRNGVDWGTDGTGGGVLKNIGNQPIWLGRYNEDFLKGDISFAMIAKNVDQEKRMLIESDIMERYGIIK